MVELNSVNYLNLLGFIINVLFTAFATLVFDLPDNATLSAEYQTIITPSDFTFSIWAIIFLSQLICTIYQMLPKYRATPIVQDGIHLMFFYACMAQSAWTVVFGYKIFWLSVIAMFCILTSLFFIVVQQSKIDVSVQQFWLFKFPFLVHFAWIFTAFLLNVNLTLIASRANTAAQIWFACISLGLVVLLAIESLITTKIPNGPFYTIPAVFVWATFGMTIELHDPKDLILETFSMGQIGFFRMLTACLSTILIAGMIVYGIYDYNSKTRNHTSDVINASTPLVA